MPLRMRYSKSTAGEALHRSSPAMTRNPQQRVTADSFRGTVYTWTAPTLNQIVAACPGLSQQIDGDRYYLIPHNGKQLPITYGALERLYASAAAV